MKAIFMTAIITIVFVVALSFIEAKRTENLNRIALEYQEALGDQYISSIDTSNTSVDVEDDTDTYEVKISGAVSKEGTYVLDEGSTISDLVSKGGGLSSDADNDAINLDYIIVKDMDIYIPKQNNNNKISINSANAETLDMLPGIGATLANRIVDYRSSNGNFEIIEDILSVEGIGEALFNKIKDYIKL